MREANPARGAWPQLAAGSAAVLGLAAYLWCFYPGSMSADSGYAWWMARGGESNNVQGIGLTWLWRLTDRLVTGPAGPFLCIHALFWFGLAAIAQTLARPLVRVAVVVAVAVAPVCVVLLSHVWSDVALMAALSAATGALLCFRRQRTIGWLLAALLLLWWALLLRHNALPAVLPLYVYAVYLWNSGQGGTALLRRNIAAAALGAVLWLASVAADRAVDHRVNSFPSLAMWDLAAISLDTGSVLLPLASHGPGLDVDDLRRAYVPYANLNLYIGTRAGIGNPFPDAADPVNDQIAAAWRDAIRAHPGAYLSHRWRLTLGLFGTRPRSWPHELVYVDGDITYRDNPPVAPNTTFAHASLVRGFEALRDTAVLAAWPYVLLALVAIVVAWRRRGQANAKAALAVLSSGLLYAAPLPFIAPSAELRYLGWTCLCAVLGAALAFVRGRIRGASSACRPAP